MPNERAVGVPSLTAGEAIVRLGTKCERVGEAESDCLKNGAGRV